MKALTPFQKYLPYYKDRYDFMLCPKDRIEDVVAFIDTYWKKDHIFVLSRELLDWQHYDPIEDRYAISIAVNKKTGEIHAMVGVTLSSHFDAAIKSPVRWGSLLKIRPDIDEPGLGLMVEWFKNESSFACADTGVGESPTAIRLARKNGAQTGVMEQYYMLHPAKQAFAIAQCAADTPRSSGAAPECAKAFRDCTADYDGMEGSAFAAIPCFKSKTYYANRYLHHPIYRYRICAIQDGTGDCIGVFVWRLCEAEGSRCIRITDYFGIPGALSGCRVCFETLLVEQDAEYIDFLCVGMQPDLLEAAGFLERHQTEGLILPDYFEPFLRQNVEVTYSYTGIPEAGVIFKGDSDKDRPNLLRRG